MSLMQFQSRIHFGFGARKELPGELALLGITRALLVTDRGVVASGVYEQAVEFLEKAGIAATYDGVVGNPTSQNVDEALVLYREHRCDGVVAIGGGSSIDTAKAVALLATHEGSLAEYRVIAGDNPRITDRVAPVVAVPTTAGTGSELTRGAGIRQEDGEKSAIRSPHLVPKAAICDPELTLSLPPQLTAGTGLDALSHCVEAYLAPSFNPPMDAIALDGIERLMRYLPRAYADGNDREARENVLMGAIEGGLSLQKGLGPAHALSIPLDALHLHHGMLVGVLLPHSVAFVSSEIPPPRLERLARAMGADGETIPERLRRLNQMLDMPADLAALNIADDMLAAFAEEASGTIFNHQSARPGSSRDYLDLARSALHKERDAIGR